MNTTTVTETATDVATTVIAMGKGLSGVRLAMFVTGATLFVGGIAGAAFIVNKARKNRASAIAKAQIWVETDSGSPETMDEHPAMQDSGSDVVNISGDKRVG